MNRISQFLFLFLFFSFSFHFSEAKNFTNAYISFEMLDNWKCNLNGTEWVCRSTDAKEAKEAVIVLTAKEKGPTDKIELYKSHIDSPITTNSKLRGLLTSTIVYKSQTNRYNGQLWIDGLHRDSEVRNYFTRYLATIKDNIAVLVTFSAHNKSYAKYNSDFTNTIRSLKVIADKNLIPSTGTGIRQGTAEIFGNNLNQPGLETSLLESDKETTKPFLKNEKLMGFLLLILAILFYVGFKIYQKREK